MLRQTLFMGFVFSLLTTHAQTSLEEVRIVPCATQKPFYEIPFSTNQSGIMEVEAEINGVKRSFHFDTGASTISFGNDFFQYMVKKGHLKNSDILGRSKTVLGNGKEIEVMRVNIHSLVINDLHLIDVEAIVMDNPNVPPLLGQSVFKKFSNISIDNKSGKIILQKNDDVETVKKLVTADSTLRINKITVEDKPVPAKAIDNLPGSAVTVRYFHPDEEETARKISAQLLLNRISAEVQNMMPRMKRTIPDYIEIWIK